MARRRGTLGVPAVALVAAWLAAVPGVARAAAGADLTADEPPAARSWHAPSSPATPAAPDDDPAGLEAAPGAEPAPSIKCEERMMVRALVRMVVILVGVVIGMLLLARGARVLQTRLPRWVGGATGQAGGPSLHIVERLSLGPRHTLAWVERDGACFLVAFGEGGTSLLGPIGPASRPSFAATMAEVTHEPRPPDDAATGAPASPSIAATR